MIFLLLVLAVVWVAFTNGANANFKGVASLYGSGTMSLRAAAIWGTAATFAGSLAGLLLADGLLEAFSGKGLVPDSLTVSPVFLCAVSLGGAGTSFLATRLGFPVSTTHALVGALIGAGIVGNGTVNLGALGTTFVYPLLFSPIVAAVVGGVSYLILRAIRLAPAHRTRTLDTVHFLAAGAASFARGLNDTPKIAAPLLIVPNLDVHWIFFLVAASMAWGGIVDIRNVAETLAKKVTAMNPGQGFSACLVTAVLVCTASFHAMPVSTTHVSVGSLMGMGLVTRQAHWRKIGEVMLAWICTVPCGAILAVVAYGLLQVIAG
ncbi:MAG: inorganic phosphate transporter [Bacteroidales bacterium]|nr:inorganic phosphate transporter [Bacteroidales bacterium]